MNNKVVQLLENGYQRHWFTRHDDIYIYYKINNKDSKENAILNYYKYNAKSKRISDKKVISFIDAMYISKLYDSFY